MDWARSRRAGLCAVYVWPERAKSYSSVCPLPDSEAESPSCTESYCSIPSEYSSSTSICEIFVDETTRTLSVKGSASKDSDSKQRWRAGTCCVRGICKGEAMVVTKSRACRVQGGMGRSGAVTVVLIGWFVMGLCLTSIEMPTQTCSVSIWWMILATEASIFFMSSSSGDNVPVFSYLTNGDLLASTSLPKRSKQRWFRLHLF